jgi:hypothetical protein
VQHDELINHDDATAGGLMPTVPPNCDPAAARRLHGGRKQGTLAATQLLRASACARQQPLHTHPTTSIHTSLGDRG